MSIGKHEINMCEGSLFGKIVRFTLPLIVMNALQLFYTAADMIVVSRFEGDLAVAAIGAASPLITLIVNVFIGLSSGVSVCIGYYIGARRENDIKRTVETSALLGIVSGLIVAVIGVLASGLFLSWMETPDDIFAFATSYARIYFLGAPANLLFNFMSAVLRARGDTGRPLYILLICGIVNVLLNFILVGYFGIGVIGVAIATVVSQYLSAIIVLIVMVHDGGAYDFSFRRLRFHKDILGRLLALGLPSGIQSSVFSISGMIIQSAVNSFGSVAIAGNTAAGNIDTFSYIAFNSFQTTCIAFVSQNYGARNMKRAERAFKLCMISAVAVAILTGWCLCFFSDILLELYLPGEISAISFGMVRMKYICIPYFILALMDVTVGALRGFGSSLVPTVISIIGSCGIRVLWIFTVFKAYKTPDILYLSFPIAWLVTFVSLLIAYFFIKKRREREMALQTDFFETLKQKT
ncbi:MAG: MATE family efflux transporter [Clostridia bacterium]|nr:MATE family efflux transporter [Clostridia bacterium]